MVKQFGKARDHNEKEIVEALRKAGCLVYQLEPPMPDLLVGRDRIFRLVEVKQPKGKLTIGQVEMQKICAAMQLPFHVVRSVEEALECL